MAKRLEPHEAPLAGLNRLVNVQLDEMRDAAASQDDNRAHRIHLACKRIRTCLRLMKDALGDERYRYENAFFRNLGRPFGTFRDTEVAHATIDGLVAAEPESLPAEDIEVLRGIARRLPMPDSADLSEARIASAVAAAHKRFAEVPQVDYDFDTAVRRLYRRHRRTFRAAKKTHDTEALHEWRKQTKYLRYALDTARDRWPGADTERRKIKAVGDILGEDHDLAALHDGLATGDPGDSADKMITRRRAKLQKKALKRGKALTREKPRAFVESLKG